MGSLPPSDSAALPSNSSTNTLTEITYNGKLYRTAKEGTAEILELQLPKDTALWKPSSSAQTVFYNPIQQYNRDLSVLAIKAFGDDVAAVRQANYQRRLKQSAEGVQRGQKRKRAQLDGTRVGEDTANTESKGHEEVAAAATRIQSPNAYEEERRSTKKAKLVEAGEAQADAPTHLESSDNHEQAQVLSQGTEIQAKGGASSAHGEAKDKDNPTKPPSFRILDALSATGLRALRYAKEIPMATLITANDLSHSASASIKLNVEYNKVSDKVIPNTGDAIEHMRRAASRGPDSPGLYHVIDLDPYGTAAPFLDAALQALVDGGFLCITCTDSGVFASLGYLEKTYSLYGGLPLKGAHAHEGGLRLILHAIATSAARYGIAIEPLLSLSIDFYIRVFVRIHRSPANVKFLASKTMMVYNCDVGCGAWSVQHFARLKEKKAKNGDIFYTHTSALAPSANMLCEHCGFKTHQAGPMWGGPLHNPHFIQRILDMLPSLDRNIYGTIPRIEGMLNLALHEHLDDASTPVTGPKPLPDRPIPTINPVARSHHPFFFHPSSLARVLHCVAPSDAALRGALKHLGYRVTRSHTKAGSMTTDAPWSVIWEIMREWVRQKSPIKKDSIKKGTACWAIMQKDRSRAKVMEFQRQIREAIDNPDFEDMAGFRNDVEAALYRTSKIDDEPEDQAQEIHGEDGGVVLPNNGEELGKDSDQKESEKVSLSNLKVVFDEKLGKEPEGKRMVRYQFNPRPDWGPMNRAKGD
ncbi:hypothetical protein JMJ35_008758 [Cladonia borealis]|uniref:tRNA (guanine(26)-N(2))-dimethyltransferase n=1 Tax=Cladonia borealis TaxID=184061 RepID=A0AA39UYG1_9LECA|nr:hypothetical protein JMJ35_008758 [Cladonia borealis]